MGQPALTASLLFSVMAKEKESCIGVISHLTLDVGMRMDSTLHLTAASTRHCELRIPASIDFVASDRPLEINLNAIEDPEFSSARHANAYQDAIQCSCLINAWGRFRAYHVVDVFLRPMLVATRDRENNASEEVRAHQCIHEVSDLVPRGGPMIHVLNESSVKAAAFSAFQHTDSEQCATLIGLIQRIGSGAATSVSFPERSDFSVVLGSSQQTGSSHLIECARLSCQVEGSFATMNHLDENDRLVPVIKDAFVSHATKEDPLQVKLDQISATQVILTGATGGIGSLIMLWLGQQSIRVHALSRRAAVSKAVKKQSYYLESNAVDIGCTADVEAVSVEKKPLWLHCAGVLSDQLVRHVDLRSLRSTWSPKVNGVLNILKSAMFIGIDSIVAFGSIAAVLGNSGQSSYMMANKAVEQHCIISCTRGIKAQTIHWGPWKGRGMVTGRVEALLQRQGFDLMSNEAGLRNLQALLGSSTSGPSVACVFRSTSESQVSISPIPSTIETSKSACPSEDEVLELILELAQDSAGACLGPESAFIESGIDSLSVTEFSFALSEKLGISIHSTTLFDFPTPASLAAYITRGAESERVPEVSHSPMHTLEAACQITDIACRYPITKANSIETMSSWLFGDELTTETPFSRWDIADWYNPSVFPRSMYTRFGSWLDKISDFDAELFGLIPDECETMDPQARILLELVADVRSRNMISKSVGSFLGIMYTEYLDTQLTSNGLADCMPTSITGNGMSFIAGRLSYHHKFEGPCLAVDTACSSSLVAVNSAVESLRRGSETACIAEGINLMLSPQTTSRICLLGALSPVGRCKTADSSADGYGRGESGSILLLTFSQDDSIAVISSVGVGHNGQTGGLTAPNGRAQTKLIQEVWRSSGTPPPRVLSLHGTGTQLGDPIEFGAALKASTRNRINLISSKV